MSLRKFCCCFAATSLSFLAVDRVSANDSSYFGSGNQIIPLQETDISVKKEVLTIKRIEGDKVRITVDYIFHNPKQEKSILMGFEAQAPHGDAVSGPKRGLHPYIENFSVNFNGKKLTYKVSLLTPKFQDDGSIILLYNTEDLDKNLIKLGGANGAVMFGDRYVYHFPATFAQGDTRIIHTYDYAISSAVLTKMSIEYLLTPALRWANKQIDDFTLVIDLGEFQQYHMDPTFFSDLSQWKTQGRVRIAMEDVRSEMTEETSRMMTVFQHHGSITFHAKNFRPKGDLKLFANYVMYHGNVLDAYKMKLSVSVDAFFHDMKLKDEFTRKVLQNMPYARRGHIFKNQELKTFFKAQPWYMPDTEYKDASITDEEKKWLKEVSALKIEK